MRPAGRGVPEPDSGHAGTISITADMRRASWNAMKPRIQRVLTPWNPGSSASGAGRSAGANAAESRIQYVRWCVLTLPGAALGDRGAQEEAWRRGYPTGLPGHGQVVAVSPVLGDHAVPGAEPVGLGDGERLPGRRHDAVHGGGAGPEADEVAGMAARQGHVQDHQVVALDDLVDLEAQAGERLAEPLAEAALPRSPARRGRRAHPGGHHGRR